MTYLTKNEKEKLLSFQTKKWSNKELGKLKESLDLGASPMDIFRANILPKKTYNQIRSKIRSLNSKERFNNVK